MPHKKIAAIVTTFFPGSHADLLVSRFVKGFPTVSGLIAPKIDVVSMYMDQAHPQDVGVELARDHGIELFPSIRSALTLRQPPPGHWPTAPGWEIGELAVDGVLIIAEHGDYAPQRAWPPDVPAPPLLRAGMRDDRAVRPGRSRIQRQAPGLLVARRPLDVRPRRRPGHSLHGRIVAAGHGPDAGAGARDRRAYRRGPGARPLPRLPQRPRLLRLSRPGGAPVHGRAAARRRDRHRRG